MAGLAAAVVDLLIGPLQPAAALPEGHLLQYQVRRLRVTSQMLASLGVMLLLSGVNCCAVRSRAVALWS